MKTSRFLSALACLAALVTACQPNNNQNNAAANAISHTPEQVAANETRNLKRAIEILAKENPF